MDQSGQPDRLEGEIAADGLLLGIRGEVALVEDEEEDRQDAGDPGGEVLGLTAALLGMGSRCVVSAVSRVDDTAAYATMLRYHALLSGGVDAATALARADDGDLSQPAPFVCFGSTWAAVPARTQPFFSR